MPSNISRRHHCVIHRVHLEVELTGQHSRRFVWMPHISAASVLWLTTFHTLCYRAHWVPWAGSFVRFLRREPVRSSPLLLIGVDRIFTPSPSQKLPNQPITQMPTSIHEVRSVPTSPPCRQRLRGLMSTAFTHRRRVRYCDTSGVSFSFRPGVGCHRMSPKGVHDCLAHCSAQGNLPTGKGPHLSCLPAFWFPQYCIPGEPDTE